MTNKPTLLVISHVLPVSPRSGQQQRVLNTLLALRKRFHVTFLTTAPASHAAKLEQELAGICDEAIVMSAEAGSVSRIWNKARCSVYPLLTGLKGSNCRIGRIDFTIERLAAALGSRRFDCVLFEYWHAAESARFFTSRGITCVLDMHNVLWQAYERQLERRSRIPQLWKQWACGQYRSREERSWNLFNGVIAINRIEFEYVRSLTGGGSTVFYAPMGVDISRWAYSWSPVRPVRVAYYGGLASPHNREQALTCAREVMPEIWKSLADAELWIVGSAPPPEIRALAAADPRIHVTGYVEDPATVLASASAVLCPWSGTYGFRSRLIEVMAIGVPLIVYPDAFFGMDLQGDRDLLVAENPAQMASRFLDLLSAPESARAQSRYARRTAEQVFSFDGTYGRLADELADWAGARKGKGQCA